MKIALLGMSLLAPAMLWAQDDAELASAMPESKMVESLSATPPSLAPSTPPPPALIAVPGKTGSDASPYVTFVEGRAECKIGMMAIAVKNISDKPMVALVETAIYYNYHNRTAKDLRIDNLGAGEIRTIGCKGKTETANGDTHSVIRLKAAMFK